MTRSTLFAIFVLSAAANSIGLQPAVAFGDKTEAGACAIANSGNVSNSSVTCNFGLTDEQLKQVTEAAVKGATEPLTHQIIEISKTLGVTEDAAKNLLKIIGQDPTIPDDKLAEALSKVAGDYKRLQIQVAALNPNNPEARRLDEARPEIVAGHFARARDLLHQATEAQVAAAQEAEKLEQQAHAARDAQMLGAADSAAAEGDVALTERRYNEAAELFGQAAGYLSSGHASEQGGYLLRQAGALYQQGDERGDNSALRSAIETYGRALADLPRERVPLDWAGTQMNLGNALSGLGERESGTARLEQAVAAYRAALEENTRERVPLQWATTEMNLGNALERLGERESGTGRLEEAVAAYRAALEEQTRQRVPLAWATTEMNLGGALKALGERESGTGRLEEAVAAYRAALEEQTRERVPLAWATTEMNLGGALEMLGEQAEEVERDGKRLVMPRYGSDRADDADGRGDDFLEGEMTEPSVLIDHAPTAAEPGVVESEPGPAPEPVEPVVVESAAVRYERERIDAWIRNRLIAYPLASCLLCRKPIIAGAAWEEVSNGEARARFHRACYAEWRTEREAAARQALGLEG